MSAGLPFWSDDFDMDLPKAIPAARELVGDLADIALTTIGTPDWVTGRLNHPCAWNGDHGMVAFFGLGRLSKLTPPALPAGFIAPRSVTIHCTLWEALRDAWPHQYIMHIERVPIWDTGELWLPFQDIMFHLRGLDSRQAADGDGREIVRASLERAVATVRSLVTATGHDIAALRWGEV